MVEKDFFFKQFFYGHKKSQNFKIKKLDLGLLVVSSLRTHSKARELSSILIETDSGAMGQPENKPIYLQQRKSHVPQLS